MDPTRGLTMPHDFSNINDGWVLGQAGELLFWVPPVLRRGLYQPRNTLVISNITTQLDLSSFAHGEAWSRCRENPV